MSNSPAPLQTEIQAHMSISDTQFNLYYSIKSLSSVLPPIILTAIGIQSLKKPLLMMSLACALGQMIFALGLSYKSQ